MITNAQVTCSRNLLTNCDASSCRFFE